MNSKATRRLNRFTISAHGLDRCIDALDELHKVDEGGIAYEALLSFAVITYARPFSKNEKYENSPAISRVPEIEAILTPEERILHKKIIDLRNKAIAHAEWGKHSTYFDGQAILSAPYSVAGDFAPSDLFEFMKLVWKVRSHFDMERAVLFVSLAPRGGS